MRIRGFIFDLDGTLGDTIPVCVEAFRRTFERYAGRRFADREIVAMFGPDEAGILGRQVPEAVLPEAVAMYLAEYERAHGACREPFPGIVPLLARLHERGVPLGIVTGKGPRSAELSLRAWDLERWFDGVEAGATKGPVKPAGIRALLARWRLSPAEAAYVGDAPYDVDAAKDVGVVSVAAAWAASTDAAALAARRPDHLFARVAELAAWADEVTR